MENEIIEIKQKIDSFEFTLNSQLATLNQKIDDSLNVFANLQMMTNAMTQIVNSQVHILNQISQQMNQYTLKLNDMEISNLNSDTSFSEIVQGQQAVLNQLEEIKTSVENIRFYYPGN